MAYSVRLYVMPSKEGTGLWPADLHLKEHPVRASPPACSAHGNSIPAEVPDERWEAPVVEEVLAKVRW